MKNYQIFLISFLCQTIIFLQISIIKQTIILTILTCLFFCLLPLKRKLLLKSIAVILISGLISFLLILYNNHQDQVIQNKIPKFPHQGSVSIEGKVTDIIPKSKSTQLIINITKYNHKTISQPAPKLLITTSNYPRYQLHQSLIFQGIPKNLEGLPTAYLAYLKNQNIIGTINFPQIKLNKNQQTNYFYQSINSLKNQLSQSINNNLPYPESAFLTGLLLGERTQMPQELLTNFRHTGLTHIIAISGFNITILIIFINHLFSFIPFKVRFFLTSSVIIVFTILVGASTAVIRAAIMGILGLFALTSHRPQTITNITLLSAFIMTIYNPKIILNDIGFQLSFLAVLSLIHLHPIILQSLNTLSTKHKCFAKLSNPNLLTEAFLTTISAQILVLPIILINFHQLSIISPIANIFVTPLIPLTMATGFILILTDQLLPTINIIPQIPTYILLHLMIKSANFFGSFKYASIQIYNFHWGHGFIYYSIVAFIVHKNKLSASSLNCPAQKLFSVSALQS